MRKRRERERERERERNETRCESLYYIGYINIIHSFLRMINVERGQKAQKKKKFITTKKERPVSFALNARVAMIFILDSVKDTDFYKKNRVPRTTDSRLVELATKLQSLDSLALFYFSSLLLLIIAIHLTFVFVRWFKKRVDVFRKTRYDVINYRLVKVTTKSDDNDGKKGEVDNSPCLLYTSPSPRDATLSRMPSSA